MSNLIKEINIWRFSSNGNWEILTMNVKVFNGVTSTYYLKNEADRNEDEALSDIINTFERQFNSENFRLKIIHEFRQMRGNDYRGHSRELISGGLCRLCKVYEALEPHFSCKKTSNEDSTEQAQEENKISHSE